MITASVFTLFVNGVAFDPRLREKCECEGPKDSICEIAPAPFDRLYYIAVLTRRQEPLKGQVSVTCPK